MEIIYDHTFNSNEWFVILIILGGAILMLLLKRYFTALESVACYLYGMYWGMFFDHTLSVVPWDFYDVNDRSAYQFMDFLTYVSYGPFSYFFIYFYVRLNIKGVGKNIAYLFCWLFISYATETLSLYFGLYHYDKGYKPFWSPPTYMFTQLLLLALFHIHLRLKDQATS
jgi:hypothetical protein